MKEENEGTASGSGSRSLLRNIREALQLSWHAAPKLFAGLLVVPLLQALLVGAQLFYIRRFAQVFLDKASASDSVIRAILPSAAVILGCLVVTLVLDNVQTIGRELLTERVRQVCARRMHQAIGRLELIDFDYPETHDRVLRASGTDFRPAQVVRGLTAALATVLRIVVLTAAVLTIVPLLLPLLAVLAVPVLITSRALAGSRHGLMTRLTPLERRRLYYNRLLTARDPAAEGRAYGLGGHFSAQFDALSAERESEMRGMLRRQWRQMIGGQVAFTVLIMAAAALLGWFFTSGRADAAVLITAAIGTIQVAALIGSLGFPFGELAEAGLFLGDQAEFLRQVESGRPDASPGAEPVALERLEVRDVSFSYPTADRAALDKVSLTVERGQIVALVGPNGSGKSTLAKIIGTLYEPDSGSLRWNGDDLTRLDRAQLRDRIATVFQDFQTYSGSIAENVSLGAVRGPVDRTRVTAALEAVGFRPDELDLDRMIGPEYEGGTGLSGGQMQRLAIARALYRQGDLLILDEPTSALDARAEHTLMAELRRAGQTAVLISHRLANIAEADRILLFGEGRVIEEGTHAELMALGGVYHELYTLQANLFSHGETDVSLSFNPAATREGGTR